MSIDFIYFFEKKQKKSELHFFYKNLRLCSEKVLVLKQKKIIQKIEFQT